MKAMSRLSLEAALRARTKQPSGNVKMGQLQLNQCSRRVAREPDPSTREGRVTMRYFLLVIAFFVALGLALDSWLELPACGGRLGSRDPACKGVGPDLVAKKLWGKATN
jgi:hypothetical protein